MYLSKCLFRFEVNISPAIHFFIILPSDIRETKPQTKPNNRKERFRYNSRSSPLTIYFACSRCCFHFRWKSITFFVFSMNTNSSVGISWPRFKVEIELHRNRTAAVSVESRWDVCDIGHIYALRITNTSESHPARKTEKVWSFNNSPTDLWSFVGQ